LISTAEILFSLLLSLKYLRHANSLDVQMLLVDGFRYVLQEQTNEEKLENMVKEHSKEIFGETTVYFGLKHKIISKAGLGSVPDGYVIDFGLPHKWVSCRGGIRCSLN